MYSDLTPSLLRIQGHFMHSSNKAEKAYTRQGRDSVIPRQARRAEGRQFRMGTSGGRREDQRVQLLYPGLLPFAPCRKIRSCSNHIHHSNSHPHPQRKVISTLCPSLLIPFSPSCWRWSQCVPWLGTCPHSQVCNWQIPEASVSGTENVTALLT